LWFGIGTPSLIFVIVHSVLWPVALACHGGFLAVPPTLRMAGHNIGLGGGRFVLQILVPAAFPQILSGLRIGWVRTPGPLRRGLVVAKQAADLHSSTVDQAAAAAWLADVDLGAHVARLCDVYRERRDALLGGLGDALPPGSTWNSPAGGMFVWARLPAGHDAQELLTRAIEQRVAFVPGAPFFSGTPDSRALRLSFTTHAPREIRSGLERLRASW